MTNDEACFQHWAKEFAENNNGAVDYETEEEMKKLSGSYLINYLNF